MDQNIKKIVITCPEGYEVDYTNSTFECIKFKPIEQNLPKTWEEFCKTHPVEPGEYYISPGIFSNITRYNNKCQRLQTNILPSLEYAKAILALCQLIQLRDCYNDGWKPDWNDRNTLKYCLGVSQNRIIKEVLQTVSEVMAFKTEELREKFLENFKDLIEIAKPLL
jgi:hypothetical protein